jgi:hypothetical protein
MSSAARSIFGVILATDAVINVRHTEILCLAMGDQINDSRYTGRPLMRVLDMYVLAIIGQLSDESSAVVDELTRLAFRGSEEASWENTIERELQLGPRIRDSLRDMWEGYQKFESANGRQPEPSRFAMSVVDENFAPLIDRL